MNEEELIQETRRLIGRWGNVRITGLGWSGDTRRGFQFNPTDVRTGGGGGGSSGVTPPPPTTSGACCPEEGDCFIATQSICEAGGGTYQGDDTTCDPDPCPSPTGACCAEDGGCTITTEADCTGTYQGDGTVCDPHPCCSNCGFDAFDGSGRKFLYATIESTGDCTGGGFDTADWSATAVVTQDPVSCAQSLVSCDGLLHDDGAADKNWVAGGPQMQITDLLSYSGTACGTPNVSTNNSYAGSETGHTATVINFAHGCTREGSGGATVTLSGEVFPCGFSPPP